MVVRDWLFLLDDAQDVVFSQDETVFAVDLDLGAGVLSEQDGVTRLDVELSHRAIFENLAVAYGDDLALDGLLLRGIGDDDPALGHGLFFDATDDNAVLQRPNAHGANSFRRDVVLERRTVRPFGIPV